MDIRKYVDNIFDDSQSISLVEKSEFGQQARTPEARLLFAKCVDEHRVKSQKVNELTFYSLAQHFSIVLLECLLAEDFRPAKIIMNMMFTYYYEQNCDKTSSADLKPKTYLYTLLKDQQIFKSIRFWTSAFYESVVMERSNHSVFVDRDKGKLSNERRNEELDCSNNITFGLLGSFIHNMTLLELSHEFCQEFLDKHSTIAGLPDEQMEMLRTNMKSMFDEASGTPAPSPASTSEKLAIFLQKLSTKLNHGSTSQSKDQTRKDIFPNPNK